jgi:hypothetical protein
MKIIALILFFSITTRLAMAQLGDFNLKQSPQRSFKKICANPTLTGTAFRHLTIGKNYRSEWVDSITVPVLNFKTDLQGLIPEKEGGGKQTRTLQVKDGTGREWVLRSVRKYPDKIIANELKGTLAEKIVRDGISASYPYNVLSIGTLAKAAGIPYFPNTLVYIPDDPQLGQYRSKFGNSLAFLELRTTEDNKEQESFDTNEIIHDLQQSGDKKVDQRAVLRARLLDNFIMDWDRHEEQWEWVQKDSAGHTWYYTIPKDRDQAFLKGEGLAFRFIARKPAFGILQGLKAKPKNILTFNYSARYLDRTFLTELDENAWKNEIDTFLASMTDGVIEKALQKQPEEIHQHHAALIIDVLKNKRYSFKEDMMKYYRFLSEKVSIVGSNNPELFTIIKNSDSTVTVQVENVKASTIQYKRTFHSSVTKEIRVYGLQGDDNFWVKGGNSPIKIRFIGGPGEDTFNNEGNGKRVFVYDVSFEKNTITGTGFKKNISPDLFNNEYNPVSSVYNSSSAGIYPEYSIDGGLLLGLSYRVTTTGFRKEPYASQHLLYGTRALQTSAWHLGYNATFTEVANKTDLLIRTELFLPTIRTNFFGWGNNTVFDENKGVAFYRIQYTLLNASVMARQKVNHCINLEYGPALQYFQIPSTKNNNKFFGTIYPSPVNDAVYEGKWYAGAQIKATIDTRNDALIPTRGMYASVFSKPMTGIFSTDNNFIETGAEISFFSDAILKDRIIFATSFGANRNFGDFEFVQAQYLGFNQNLRGYRFQRFAGGTRVYNNAELRINFGDLNFYLFKGPAGIVGFHDIGRVWMKGETSHDWHNSYGGGIWLAPYKKILLVTSFGFSKEEKALPVITLGFQF